MQATEFFDNSLINYESSIAKDIKLNLKRIFDGEFLSKEESALASLALGQSLADPKLVAFSEEILKRLDFTSEQIKEAKEAAAIMSMLNTYYKFRTFMQRNVTEAEMEPYKTAKLRMMSIARPNLGKERFEMLAFAVSVLNGCESCVVSHEKALREAGVSPEKTHELARLASCLKAFATLTSGS